MQAKLALCLRRFSAKAPLLAIRASGQALYNGIVWGLGGMVGGKICGGIAETHGMSVMFKISSIIALLAALITSIFGKDPQSSLKKANK